MSVKNVQLKREPTYSGVLHYADFIAPSSPLQICIAIAGQMNCDGLCNYASTKFAMSYKRGMNNRETKIVTELTL